MKEKIPFPETSGKCRLQPENINVQRSPEPVVRVAI
jgi:hypothetical protein